MALLVPLAGSIEPLGLWAKLGRATQRFWWLALPLLVGVAIPFCFPLLNLSYVEGVLPLLPRGEELTDNFLELQASFGITTVFPSTLVILPPSPADLSQAKWLNASCYALKAVRGRKLCVSVCLYR